MRVTYWKSECLDDSDAYSIRTQTKKECKTMADAANFDAMEDLPHYGPPTKVTLDYDNGFELITLALGENRACELMVTDEGCC